MLSQRRKGKLFRGTTLFYEYASYTHRIRIYILYPAPLTVGLRLRLLSSNLNLGQLLQGQFRFSHLLSRITRQLSVFRSKCTIPYQRFFLFNDITIPFSPRNVKPNFSYDTQMWTPWMKITCKLFVIPFQGKSSPPHLIDLCN